MKTTWISQNQIERKWYLVDVEGLTLGRVASEIAKKLIGKAKVDRVPNMDCGDHVVVVNAEKVVVSGNKESGKTYFRHSGYPGGMTVETFEDLKERYPEKLIIKAVKNMLPNNKMRKTMIARLWVYKGDKHPHEAQNPEKLDLKS